MKPKVYFFPKYTPSGPSSRIRIYQYLAKIEDSFTVEVFPLLPDSYIDSIYNGSAFGAFQILRCYAIRLYTILFFIKKGSCVFIEKELFPYLPGWIEKILLRRLNVILDYDDATYHVYDESRSFLVRMLLGKKIGKIITTSKFVICGNAYLASYALEYVAHDKVIIIPSTYDGGAFVEATARAKRGVTRVGWIGNPGSQDVLWPILPVLEELSKELRFEVVLIGVNSASFEEFDVQAEEWSLRRERSLLESLDIGIMPLQDVPFQRGKCAFKLIQYMAAGLPVVCSPVGVNTDVVDHGETGFLAETSTDWQKYLSILVKDEEIRRAMGCKGKIKFDQNYSIDVGADLVRGVIARAVA